MLALGCGSGVESPSTRTSEGLLASTRLEGVRFESYSDATTAVEVNAARARIESETLAHLDHVTIGFHASDRGRVEISAARGRLDLKTHDFVLLGEVTGSTGAGERFTTARVRYEAAASRLWTDQPVRVERGGLITEGDGLEIDLESHRLEIRGRVRATLGAS